MKILAVTNQKGGVAKTTTAVNVAHALALAERRVLLVDLDPQGQCATALAVNPEPCVFRVLITPTDDIHQWIRQTRRERLEILPGDRTTATAQTVIAAENRPITAIYEILTFLSKEYDYIILDTAPSVGGIQERAIYAANIVLVPTATEYLSMDGLAQTMELLQRIRKDAHWSGGLAGVLPTFYDELTDESKKSMEQLKATFGDDYLLHPIHRATVLRECAAEGKTIFEKSPSSRSSQEYTALAREVLRRS
jgi:chromosome partitioning protein